MNNSIANQVGGRFWCGLALLLIVSAVLPSAALDAQQTETLFLESERCIACHSNISAPSGADISIGYDWRATMMANSARDPYFFAAVRREIMDNPGMQAAIEDKCATCHMPIGRTMAAAHGAQGAVFATLELAKRDPAAAHLALDGVSCTLCHQITADNFGKHDSFDGGFKIDTKPDPAGRKIFGPHSVDVGRTLTMHSSTENFRQVQSAHIQQSELCATCHTLYTQAVGADGQPAGTLPEQMPYAEWLASSYATTRSCQSCHMPEVGEPAPISSVLGQNRPNVSRHTFVGGNAYMLRVLNKFRGELGVIAMASEMEASVLRTQQYLRTATATIAIGNASRQGNTLSFAVAVSNLSGHKFPTAYPSRRSWLHVKVSDSSGRVVFESGQLQPSGNDNDADGARYEPHYRVIERADQVQIYESMMVDSAGAVTTALLRGSRYIKDNRLLPAGMRKSGAHEDIAVRGDALADADFDNGADAVQYQVDVGNASGELKVEVAMLFQSVAYRWAQNLKRYDAPEPQRFVGYYEATASASAETIASAQLRL
jgi:hypothetical protein